MAVKMLNVPQRTMRIMKLDILDFDDTDDGIASSVLYVPEDDIFPGSDHESISTLEQNMSVISLPQEKII